MAQPLLKQGDEKRLVLQFRRGHGLQAEMQRRQPVQKQLGAVSRSANRVEDLDGFGFLSGRD